MWTAAEPLQVTKSQRAQLEGWIGSPTSQQRVVQRSRIVLLAGDGKANHAGSSAPCVGSARG
jgi:hypothetical protein